MSRTFHTLDRLDPPFSLVDERVISVPSGATLETNNDRTKIIAYFEGNFEMVIDGVQTYSIRPGDFIVVPGLCQQIYYPKTSKLESRLHVFRLVFDSILTETSPFQKNSMHPLAKIVSSEFPQTRFFPGGLKGEVGRLLNLLLKEIDAEAVAYRINAQAILQQMIVEVIRLARKPVVSEDDSKENRTESLIQQTRGWINENFEHPFKLADVAWHLRLSEEHLARLFRHHTGETIMDYTRRLRIDKARRLLLSSNETLSSIAKACGFRSLAVFSVNFKQITNQGPGTYRRLQSPRIAYPKSNLKWIQPS